ncbi:iron-containing alcohol dehydrogenase [Bacillus sp. FSL W7-1034]|uniref:iron-containing alcohol dehydrogenase n=1 Tax=Bacillus TaxID=1386 RepID=UPI0002BDC084|nr:MULTISPECIES: iron-containing alcohol dehydrogenase [Bacillus]EMI12965.1 iron-containing alcohol dehydrogenase [Bacillus stratosphericus LAMA 585]ATH73635.1 iron-containing alcohol dehydrogenase [Bacillus altitudinis]MCY7438431.1 iron-containing alcohol dehydrogenase [Bacillus altitudinis]MDN4636150.1 iron-containing alcohol dehydrogenase [Bacillus sp. PsM16]MEC1143233.1 iron-containing alcohol dehydrogenase [Bacillus altitudinis]
MTISHYHFQTASHIVSGAHSLELLGEKLELLGLSKLRSIFILTQPSIVSLGYADQIKTELAKKGIASEISTEIKPEPTEENIEDVFQTFLKGEHEAIIGIGGGSVLDAAKILAVLKTNDQPISDLVGTNLVKKRGVPTILIPTTSGTGSEVTPNAIVTFPEKELKIGMVSPYLLPDLVILDPALTLKLPKAITAATGMDAFTHALESYISNKANPFSDMFALESMRLISGSIQEAYHHGDNMTAREDMLVGAMYGGMALTSAGTAAVHAMAYPLGGKYKISHGVANSMLLPHVTAFNADHIKDRLEDIARVIGIEEKGSKHTLAEQVIRQIEEWTADLHIPQQLKAFGVSKEDVPALAEAASEVKRLMDNNPKPMSVSDIEQVYMKLLHV